MRGRRVSAIKRRSYLRSLLQQIGVIISCLASRVGIPGAVPRHAQCKGPFEDSRGSSAMDRGLYAPASEPDAGKWYW